jgi:hypothetical protein
MMIEVRNLSAIASGKGGSSIQGERRLENI